VVTVFEVIRGRHHANQVERGSQFLEWAKQNVEVLDFDFDCAAKAGEIAGAMFRAGEVPS
jgi:predicted nucleic acid-binding protein